MMSSSDIWNIAHDVRMRLISNAWRRKSRGLLDIDTR